MTSYIRKYLLTAFDHNFSVCFARRFDSELKAYEYARIHKLSDYRVTIIYH